MELARIRNVLIPLALLTLLAGGCSLPDDEPAASAGDPPSGGNPPAPPAPPGGPAPIAPSGVLLAYGTVTAFGDLRVNGVRYDTSQADFTIDGQSGTDADLAVGDVVLVAGRTNAGSAIQGTADTIVFDDTVEGPIGSIDERQDSFVVLGQTVRMTDDTSFDESIPQRGRFTLDVGNIVEVSGFRRSDGSIHATRIERKVFGPFPPEVETTGIVSSLDTVGRRFDIYGLDVDYSAAMLQDFPSGAVANGDLVEVKGTTLRANDELVATRVVFVGGNVIGAVGDRVEIEGFITRFVNAGDFDVAGIRSTTTSATTVERGVAGDLTVDVKVEAEGLLDANGILVSTKITIHRAEAVSLTGFVDSVNVAASSFEALGITVTTDERTRMDDKTRADIRDFTLADLAAGDYVEVRGLELTVGSNQVLASRVEREDPQIRTELRGIIQSANAPSFMILGVTVSTSVATVFSDDDSSISAEAFFAQALPGTLARARGIEITDRAIAATEVELE
jgi:hypothetical protein